MPLRLTTCVTCGFDDNSLLCARAVILFFHSFKEWQTQLHCLHQDHGALSQPFSTHITATA